MTDIICPECNHSLPEHYEDYDGSGGCHECERLYPDPYPYDAINDGNRLKWCYERPVNLKLNMAIDFLDRLSHWDMFWVGEEQPSLVEDGPYWKQQIEETLRKLKE